MHQAKTVFWSFPFSQEVEGISTNLVNIEYRTRNRRISKENGVFDLDKRLIGFAIRVIRAAEPFIARQTTENFIIRNSLFDIRYSFFSVKQDCL